MALQKLRYYGILEKNRGQIKAKTDGLGVNNMEQQKQKKPVLTIAVLAILCIGGMELLFCRFADPALFQRITTPVVQYSRLAWGHTTQLLGNKAAELKGFADRLTIKTVEEPQVPESAGLPAAGASAPDEPPEGLVEKADKNILVGGNVDMVFYNQSDEVWSQRPYGTDDIGKYGCGPTAMSMVVSSMTVYDVNPEQMAAWAVDNGYWAPKDGSYLSIIPGTAQGYGLSCTPLRAQNADALRQELSAGGVVIALMGKGHFTDGGHFIVLRGITPAGDILVADPNSEENSLKAWDAQLILNELATGRENTLWRITA